MYSRIAYHGGPLFGVVRYVLLSHPFAINGNFCTRVAWEASLKLPEAERLAAERAEADRHVTPFLSSALHLDNNIHHP